MCCSVLIPIYLFSIAKISWKTHAFTQRDLHELGTHMEFCCLSVWLQEGKSWSFISASICIHLWSHYHQNSIAVFKPLWRNINRDISAVTVTLEQNQAITPALSQAPTYKFSTANLHKNTCTICCETPVHVCIVVAAPVVVLHITNWKVTEGRVRWKGLQKHNLSLTERWSCYDI